VGNYTADGTKAWGIVSGINTTNFTAKDAELVRRTNLTVDVLSKNSTHTKYAVYLEDSQGDRINLQNRDGLIFIDSANVFTKTKSGGRAEAIVKRRAWTRFKYRPEPWYEDQELGGAVFNSGVMRLAPPSSGDGPKDSYMRSSTEHQLQPEPDVIWSIIAGLMVEMMMVFAPIAALLWMMNDWSHTTTWPPWEIIMPDRQKRMEIHRLKHHTEKDHKIANNQGMSREELQEHIKEAHMTESKRQREQQQDKTEERRKRRRQRQRARDRRQS
jgi:hypothetical protein